MLVRHLIEEYDDELFWESLQDHGWKLHGDVLFEGWLFTEFNVLGDMISATSERLK